MAEKGRRATAEMQLLDNLFRAEVAADQLDFLFQPRKVRQCPPTIFGDDFVALAVIADVRTEWQVDVQ